MRSIRLFFLLSIFVSLHLFSSEPIGEGDNSFGQVPNKNDKDKWLGQVLVKDKKKKSFLKRNSSNTYLDELDPNNYGSNLDDELYG